MIQQTVTKHIKILFEYLVMKISLRNVLPPIVHWRISENYMEFFSNRSHKYDKFFVYILCMYPLETKQFLTEAQMFGYFTEGKAFISINFATIGHTSSFNSTGLLDIVTDVNVTANWLSVFDEVFSSGTSTLEFGLETALHAVHLADAVGVLEDILQQGDSWFNYSLPLRFQGLSGPVTVFTDGSRKAIFTVLNSIDGIFHPVIYTCFHASEPYFTFEHLPRVVVWPGGSLSIPVCPAHMCETYNVETQQAVLLTLVISVVVIGYLICLVVNRRKDLKQIGQHDCIYKSSVLYAGLPEGLTSIQSQGLAQYVDPSCKSRNVRNVSSIHGTFGLNQIYTKVTIIGQHLVSVKEVGLPVVHLNDEIIDEIKEIRSLKHANVNSLVGVCVEMGHVCTLWMYCHKGSLRDVLDSSQIRIDWLFKLSFAYDIASGMVYLHSRLGRRHGCLTSRNVVVDSNWSCKVTDISMPLFRMNDQLRQENHCTHVYNLLWLAPELLRQVCMPILGSQKGDVYAFGIIVHEIMCRGQPFGVTLDMDPMCVVRRAKKLEMPPFRPIIPPCSIIDDLKTSTDQPLLDLMAMCWDELPLLRPSFSVILHNLHHMRHNFSTTSNLVDQMVAIITRHTDSLGDIVMERTQQLHEEQRRSEDLLSRMLPKAVANDLKLGKRLEPEFYECITIFFSDIVGFTSLAAASTPLQVVNMLNNLYTIFDNIVDRSDAYKVETIGDAYMVVSGLPKRNQLHAGEIATVALGILTKVLSFRVPHFPNKPVLLRIGLHSGSALAGIVGRKMPRYCLFGEAVNFAANMESSGQPLHIHVSVECKALLDNIGGYHLVERGLVDIKNKGSVMTYFLKGKNRFPMPTAPLHPDLKAFVGISVNE